MTAEAVAKAAYMREESRGAHTREDFPGENKDWQQYNIIIKKLNNGTMQLTKTSRKEPDKELQRIAFSSLEELEKEVAKDHTK